MPLDGEELARRLKRAWWWSRTVAGPWLTDRRRGVSHLALLTVVAVGFGAGVVGAGRHGGSPGELTYLTPPDPSTSESLRLRTAPATSEAEQSPVASPVSESAPVAAYLTHEVQPGDTLYGIAERYGVEAQYLLWNNPELTSNPDLLIIGASILVPSVDGIVYDVRLGDTINAIAATYDVNPDDVVSYAPNGLASADHIIEGSVLLLPGGVPPPPPEPVPAPVDPPARGPVPAGVPPTFGPLPPASVGFIWPVNGTLWGGFGPRWGSFHKGIDVGANAGTAVVATASGQVVLSTYSDNGYGSYIIVQHADGSETLYAHLSERHVVLGQNVGQGEVIGAVGCTGWCTGNHLHFEVYVGGGVVDPLGYLP